MSKKDLLERLSRGPDGRAAVRRPAEEGEVRPRPDVAVESTRVSRKVIRRRPKDQPTAEVPMPAPVAAPPPRVYVDAATVAEPDVAPEPEPEPEPVVAAAPVEERPERAEAPVRGEQRPQQPVPEPVPEPVVEEYAPAAEPEPEPVAAQAPPQPGPSMAEEPRYAGLGRAVVMPPPGYDPTNPGAFRRRVEADADVLASAALRGRRPVEAGDLDTGADGRRRNGGGGAKAGRRNRKFEPRVKPRRRKKGGPKAVSPTPAAHKRKVRVHDDISVSDLAQQMGVKAAQVIKQLMGQGVMVTVNDALDLDTATLVASEFDYTVENVAFDEDAFLQHVDAAEEEEGSVERPPIVTVMGHVDHGKTTLLDAIRNANVAKGEAGGITQHIGAYQVDWNGRLLTFLDTPGHAAFTAMRARGADVTDLVVLVVAADDGVQPQTEEAINHARAAEVPIVVAVNKCDKDGTNPDAVRTRLSEAFGLTPEEWGGDTLYVNVSALKGQGIDKLLETVLLQAEMLDLTANPERHAEGVVIEAKMERGRGPVATILVQAGTLRRGDQVVIGAVFGRVRAMLDHHGQEIEEAPPATPVEVFGFSELPSVGDPFNVVLNEKNARTLADHRAQQARAAAMASFRKRTAEDLFAAAAAGQKPTETLHLVVKTDVGGTLQALIGALEAFDVPGAKVHLLHSGVGNITESDVNLVAANSGTLLGFNVKLDANAAVVAEAQGVEPHVFDVIYHALDFVEARLRGLLAPTFEQRRVGAAEVRAVFDISKVGRVAGCYITDGKVIRGGVVKVSRGGTVVHDGKVSGLKRFKDDIREVTSGFECGISVADFNDVQVGDQLEVFELVEVPSA